MNPTRARLSMRVSQLRLPCLEGDWSSGLEREGSRLQPGERGSRDSIWRGDSLVKSSQS